MMQPQCTHKKKTYYDILSSLYAAITPIHEINRQINTQFLRDVDFGYHQFIF